MKQVNSKESSKYSDDDLFFDDLISSYVNSSRFVERHWLFKKIKEHLADPECRIIVLSAEPGAGKTAFVAWLANQQADWLRYFIRSDSKEQLRSGDARSFLFTVGYQLAFANPAIFKSDSVNINVSQNIGSIETSGSAQGISVDELYASPFYQTSLSVRQQVKTIQGKVTGVSIKKLVSESSLLTNQTLQKLGLFKPAQKLLKEKPSTKLVILIDALDELRFHDVREDISKWLLGLGVAEIPSNIRFVISSRPLDRNTLNIFRQHYGKSLREVTIDPSSNDVREDLYKYAKYFTSQYSTAQILDSFSIDSNRFIKQSIIKAEGNFQYLGFLYRGIEQEMLAQNQDKTDGELVKGENLVKLLQFEDVPAGLENLYGFFLDLIKSTVLGKSIQIPGDDIYARNTIYISAWEGLYQPILGALAVAMEPLEISQIQNFINFKGENRWLNAALDNLGQFLDRVGNKYRLYHSTFAEFLTIDPEVPSSDTSSRNFRDQRINPSEWHRNIIGYYRDTADKWINVDWSKMDNYGLSNLSSHLYKLKDLEINESKPYRQALYELICKPLMLEKLTRFGSNQSFDSDVELAFKVGISEDPPNLAMIIRNALIHTILEKISSNVPPKALAALALLGNYSKAQGLAALISNKDKIVAFILIGGSLIVQGNMKKAEEIFSKVPALLNETLYEKGSDLLYALDRFFFYLVQLEGGNKAISLVKEYHKYELDNVLFYYIAIRLAESGDFENGLQFANSIEHKEIKAMAIATISKLYVGLGQKEKALELIEHAISYTQSIKDILKRSQTLADVSRVLSVIGENKKLTVVANQILDEARKSKIDDIVVPIKGYAAQVLAQAGEVQEVIKVADELLEYAERGKNEQIEKSNLSAQIKKNNLSGIVNALAMAGEITKAKKLCLVDAFETWDTTLRLITSLYVISKIRDLNVTNLLAGNSLDRLLFYHVDDLRYDELQPDDYRVLGNVAMFLEQNGEVLKALDILETLDDDHIKKDVIELIVDRLLFKTIRNDHRSGLSERLLEIANTIRNERSRFFTLSEVAIAFIIDGKKKTAKDLIEKILIGLSSHRDETEGDDSKAKYLLFAEVSKALAEVGEFDKAEELMDKVPNDHIKADVLACLIRTLSKAGHNARALDNTNRLEVLLNQAHGYKDGQGWDSDDSWEKTIEAWSWTGQHERALEILKTKLTHWSKVTRAHIIGDISIILAELGMKIELPNIANLAMSTIKNPTRDEKGGILIKIAKAFAKIGEIDTALAYANQIKIHRQKAVAFSYISQCSASTGDKSRALQVLSMALDSMNSASRDQIEDGTTTTGKEDFDNFLDLMSGWQTEFLKSNQKVQEIVSRLKSLLEVQERIIDQSFLDQFYSPRKVISYTDIANYLIIAKGWAKLGDQKRAISLLIKTLTKVKSSDNAPAAEDTILDSQYGYNLSSLPKYTKIWAVIELGASIIGGIDQSNLLWKIYQEILETEQWYKY